VTGFARKPVSSASDHTTDRDAPANSRTYGHENGVIASLRDAVSHLGDERAGGVVIDGHCDAKSALNRRSNRNIDHALKIWSGTQNLSVFDQSGQTDSEMAFSAAHLGKFKK
jgi:hypothetical protein